ncbi:rCG19988, isoform CRA_a [Rattus norvegicus]|uniref:RCG19988, isoform CRA_a n=1 Tax=Rattus norvegicus TaxID=10116 RepID=A6KIE0_RAT|nr:rCG19988, isoform CRA_a [Rattus norvegicus]EDL87795.1 rCG19988, isoform CRA_a [Rattus norvegicus]
MCKGADNVQSELILLIWAPPRQGTECLTPMEMIKLLWIRLKEMAKSSSSPSTNVDN